MQAHKLSPRRVKAEYPEAWSVLLDDLVTRVNDPAYEHEYDESSAFPMPPPGLSRADMDEWLLSFPESSLFYLDIPIGTDSGGEVLHYEDRSDASAQGLTFPAVRWSETHSEWF